MEKHASGGFWELSILKEQIPNPRNAMEISVVRTSEYICPEKTMGSLPKINNNHAMEITETICVYENTKL